MIFRLLQKEILVLDSDLQACFQQPVSFQQIVAIEGQVFKQANNRKTMYFEMAGNSYFIKIHDGVGWREIFKNLLTGRLPVISAQNEYNAIQKLDELGINSLQLAGFGRRGFNPAKVQSFVITKALSNHVSLASLCENWQHRPPLPAFKYYLIRQIAEITRCLHNNGVNHRDLYLCHFLINKQTNDKGFPHLHLIDLHRVQIRTETPLRWRLKDLAALHFSSMDFGLSQRDRLRFIREYTSNISLRDVLKKEARLWKQVDNKAKQLYRKHNK